MEPRFTRGEYWLLEIVVEREFPVYGLIDSELEWNLNKKGHGLTRATLVETFHRLLSAGLIYAKNEGMGSFLLMNKSNVPSMNPNPGSLTSQLKKKHVLWADTGRRRAMGSLRCPKLATLHR